MSVSFRVMSLYVLRSARFFYIGSWGEYREMDSTCMLMGLSSSPGPVENIFSASLGRLQMQSYAVKPSRHYAVAFIGQGQDIAKQNASVTLVYDAPRASTCLLASFSIYKRQQRTLYSTLLPRTSAILIKRVLRPENIAILLKTIRIIVIFLRDGLLIIALLFLLLLLK